MSDDQNDKLMTQFIERATPKLLEALQSHVAKQVEDSISGLKENSTKLLDELKDAQRATAEKDDVLNQTRQLLETLGKEAPKGTADAFKRPEPVRITREQARDVRAYRAAKAEAEKLGTSVQILREG
jgi:hypothetical protein